ncbi:hypothetical protein DPMN_062715 [Dreissena polymorpha]|uniref:Uncharacterized protein n=1 Tax=Dreissena polymorpha TaxID=45954 RepID=A0A9D4C968_DREPO|nr:hypothetical protein DPMN_062715 [Dreissena polymorpha]
MNRGSTRNRDKPGLHRGRLGLAGGNTFGMNRESPGRTGNDRRGIGNNRNGTGNIQNSTVSPPGPIQTPAELR